MSPELHRSLMVLEATATVALADLKADGQNIYSHNIPSTLANLLAALELELHPDHWNPNGTHR